MLQRLQKYLAEQGVCSRRKAEILIADGLVRINGRVAELGDKVDCDLDAVKVSGQRVHFSKPAVRVFMLNKPRGFICSHGDPHNSKTIFDLLPAGYRRARLLCAGRLDKDSEGLVILTSSGEMAQRIAHPSSGIAKFYAVRLNQNFDPKHIAKIRSGLLVDGERLFARRVQVQAKGPEAGRRLTLELTQGRNREIRRIFRALGYQVSRLKRESIGGLRLKNLSLGNFRELSLQELNLLLGSDKLKVKS